MLDGGDGARDFSGDKSFAPARDFVVKQNTVARTKAVALAIIDRRPVGKNFRHPVGAARPERRFFRLRHFLRFAKHFAARSLIKARPDSRFPNGFENPDRANAGDVGGVLGDVETDPDMALRAEMINFVRLQLIEQLYQVHGIAQVAEMQKQAHTIDMRIGIKVIDARGVEGAGAADYAVHFVAFFEQKIGQVTSILAGNAGNERFLHVDLAL